MVPDPTKPNHPQVPLEGKISNVRWSFNNFKPMSLSYLALKGDPEIDQIRESRIIEKTLRYILAAEFNLSSARTLEYDIVRRGVKVTEAREVDAHALYLHNPGVGTVLFEFKSLFGNDLAGMLYNGRRQQKRSLAILSQLDPKARRVFVVALDDIKFLEAKGQKSDAAPLESLEDLTKARILEDLNNKSFAEFLIRKSQLLSCYARYARLIEMHELSM